MIKHTLKIEENYLMNLQSGIKTHEVRYNDRDYQKGDTIVFIDGAVAWKYEITHIHSGLGMKDGYVVLSLKKIAH